MSAMGVATRWARRVAPPSLDYSGLVLRHRLQSPSISADDEQCDDQHYVDFIAHRGVRSQGTTRCQRESSWSEPKGVMPLQSRWLFIAYDSAYASASPPAPARSAVPRIETDDAVPYGRADIS